jgi:hypothetical protein
MSGKTVVSLKLKTLLNEPIPAITLCMRPGYSLKRLSKLNPISTQLYSQYMDIIQNYTEMKKLDELLKLENENLSKINDQILNITEPIRLKMSAYDILTKMSVPSEG